jgi:hypothetical protein
MGKFLVTRGNWPVRNGISTMNMLNASKVNGESSYFSHATFYVIFCDSGRILDSRNPVKYSRNLRVNLGTAHSVRGRSARLSEFTDINHRLKRRLRFSQDPMRYASAT